MTDITGRAGPITIAGCNASGSLIRGTMLSGSRVEGSNLGGVVFQSTALPNARFDACDMSGVQITTSGIVGMTINGMPVEAMIAAYRKLG